MKGLQRALARIQTARARLIEAYQEQLISPDTRASEARAVVVAEE